MDRFKDKTVIVTSAASGIGLAAARRFLDEGAEAEQVHLEVVTGQGFPAADVACESAGRVEAM